MEDEAVVLGAKLEGPAWFLSRQGGWIGRETESLYGTLVAFGADAADERAKFHEC
jgi:hypothetical protein